MRRGITAAAAALVLALGAAPARAQPFSASSWRNAWLAANAPTDPLSDVYVTTLRLTANQGAFVSTNANTSTVYTVGAGQPGVRVRLMALPGRTVDAKLQAAFNNVPLPAGAHAARGL